MAFALRWFAGNLFRPVRSLCVATSGRQSFRTAIALNDRSKRRVFPCFFSDDLFSTPTPVSKRQPMKEEFMEKENVSEGVMDITEDENGLYLKKKFPGLNKEDLKIYVDGYTLKIRIDEQKSNFFFFIHLFPPEAYKMDKIKAVMKNGLLQVTVPRFKREDFFVVQVD